MDELTTPKLPKRISKLDELAHNLWWSWYIPARNLYKSLDRPLWKLTGHNPVKLLQQIEPYRLVAAAEEPDFISKYDAVIDALESTMSTSNTWFAREYPHLAQKPIAYFSLEFAIHNSLPLYAGGLGVLAGDYCKEASDLGLPLVGVGFMYPQGYVHQHINDDGWQDDTYEQLDFNAAPISIARNASGEPMRIKVPLDDKTVQVAVWQANVGRVKLYLLDTNIEENEHPDRELSARLYAGDREMRLAQEILLGIGGVRVLRALGIEPVVWHANEGHTAFMMLERTRELVEKDMTFEQAAAKVRATTVFTTHTPIPAGHDVFTLDLIERSFHRYWGTLGLDRDSFLALGMEPNSNLFNMTVLALRMSNYRNGVSELHGGVCRRMWHPLWPEVPEKDVPITSITNGIHIRTWIGVQMASLFDKYLGSDWRERLDGPLLWERVLEIPDEELWAARRWLKYKLISEAQERARKCWAANHLSPGQALAMGAFLDTEILTIGFSRRFTAYKRASLVLHDPNRLKRMLRNEYHPIQIIFSGKAHPDDHAGKQLIQEVFNAAKSPDFGGRLAFIEDYDMHMARYLVQGADVWLNLPRPLREASGTSGQKAAVNGVLHLSVLDGWWYEGYNGANGWAIHNDTESPDSPEQDKADAEALYELLEKKVIPLYYDRDTNDVPHGWVKMIKESIRSNAPRFSARRMAKDYVTQMYLPAYKTADG
ncbi:MAG: glycosyltransferase family 1 protein [Chloroflexi bacterium]|nr:glycosyltransferase family 1 protein [Chloroflexota bacterium]MBM3175081.1 glycosyltransferase family 1 protein [Chloroflexota bacterium]MBM4449715.1 glycosyltransferase family 1 protein [Chloroflexota bacterium]